MNKVFWLYGRSGAGKSTLAQMLRDRIRDHGLPVFILDGDQVRSGLSEDLGFTTRGRWENHRRMAHMAMLALGQGFNVVVSSMAPEFAHRDLVEKITSPSLVWAYIHATLETCVQRDPKGLYASAKRGMVANLTDYPFDAPRQHEQTINVCTEGVAPEVSYRSLVAQMRAQLADFEI